MLRKFALVTTAILMGASSAAFAAVPAQSPTPAPAAATHSQLMKPNPTAAKREARDAKADRETAALNDLEAAGYVSMKNVHSSGTNVMADAKKSTGDFQALMVTPAGQIEPAAKPNA